MDLLGFLFAVLLVAGTFILLRKIEHWLHQHIFKVGWLLTHNYQTTTILYYTFFFPGVVLHEVTYWLMAGALNVSADLTIKWPEPQEMGELKLNFVRISPKAGIYRRAIITATPLLVALAIIWWGANSVFDLGGALRIMSTGDLEDIAAGFRHLTNAPDFWLWVYLIFTISNTMYPAVPKDLQGWRTIAGAVAIVAVLTFVIGIGNDAFQLVGEPIGEFLLVLQGVLIFIIGINVFMTMVLGAAESAIERVTGHSATFKRGKMITMTREEAVAQRHKDRERQRKQQALATTTTRRPTAEMNISSVYALALPVPGGPDEEAFAVPGYKIEPESTPALPDRPAISPRLGAGMITVGDAPSTAPALPAGASTKTIPTVSGDAKSTSTQKAATEDQVDEAMRMMRINTPASRNAAQSDIPVTPAQIDKAVETFRAVAPDKPVSAPSADKPGDSGANLPPRPQPSPAASAAPQGSEKPGLPFNRPAPSPFGTPKPAPSQADDDDLDSFRQTDRPAAAKPVTPPSSPFNRPAPSPFGTPKPAPSQADDDDLDSFRQTDRPAAAKPVTPPSSPFNRPAAPYGTPKPAPAQADDEDDDDDLDSFRQADRPAAAKPVTPPSSPFNRPAPSPFGTPKPAPAQADNEEDEDRALFRPFDPPAAAKPSTPFNRPAAPFGTPKPLPSQSDDEDSDLGSFRQPDRPAAAKPRDPEKGVPFNRPASPFGTPKPAANDEDDEDSALFRPFDPPAAAKPIPPTNTPFKPAAPFGTPKPIPSQSDNSGPVKPTGRPATAKPPDPEKGVPFNRPASPFSFPQPADDEDEDEDLSAFRKTDRTVVTKANTPFRPGSPFGTPQSSPDNDDDDDLDSFRQSDRPAASRPNTPFKPASPFGPSSTAPKPGEKDDPNAPRQPNRPTFGSPSPTSAKPMSPFGSKPDESKPTTPPAASGPRPGAFTPPPRFGAKPNTPTGTPVPKPSAPFGRKADDDEDESIMNRPGASLHDATDDLFEDLRRPSTPTPPKRPTTTQPIIGSRAFGASRPVPKKPTQPQDEDDDELDDLRDTIRYEDEDLRYSDDDEVDVSGDDE